jgi:hypothetical protein
MTISSFEKIQVVKMKKSKIKAKFSIKILNFAKIGLKIFFSKQFYFWQISKNFE